MDLRRPGSAAAFGWLVTLVQPVRRITVLLNGNFKIIPLIRLHAAEHELFRFVCLNAAHSTSRIRRLLTKEDQIVSEPARESMDYAMQVLGIAVAMGVDLVLPMWHASFLADASEHFQRAGIQLLVAGTATQLRRVDDKGHCFDDLADLPDVVPRYRIVSSVESFDAAVSELAADHTVCLKPCDSIFGYGFYVLKSSSSGTANSQWISVDAARRRIARAGSRRHLVMQYLPGMEWSVDCLALDGTLTRAVIRRKREDGSQVIDQHMEVERAVRRCIALLRLRGLFNIQLKGDSHERPRLPEINGRMAGGIAKSAASGVVLPLWAIRLAMGTHDSTVIPTARCGVIVPSTPDDRSV